MRTRRSFLSFLFLLSAASGAWGARPSALQETSGGGAPEAPAGRDERPTVRRVLVEGHQRLTESQLLSVFGVSAGDPLDQAAVDRGIQALFDVFRVIVDVRAREIGDGSEVDLRLTVTEQPLDLEPRFVGNVEVDLEDLLIWAGLDEESAVYLFQAPRIRQRILNGYRAEGHYFAEVDVAERPGGLDPETGRTLAPDVIFDIREGPEVRVRDVEFHGVRWERNRGFLFLKRGISKLADVELRKPRFFNLFSKRFVPETLDADIVAIRQVYRDHGFFDAVVKLERLEFEDDREWVTIHIVVDEGPRYSVGSLSIQAFEILADPARPGQHTERPQELAVPEAELLELCRLTPGEPFEIKRLNRDERFLRRRYGEDGYIDHASLPLTDRWQFHDPQLTIEADSPVVHVTYRISQGRQQFIREVKIRGNLHTQDRVIRRLITLEPGDVADPDQIERSRTRIQGTGFFSDPRNLLEHREPYYRFLETEDPSWKDLEYVVEEGQDLTFNVSGGVSSNLGAFGVVQLTKRNFDITNLPSSPRSFIREVAQRKAFSGAGQELRIQASPGTEASFFDIYLREPDVFKLHRDSISLSLNANNRLRIFESHDEERERLGFTLGRQVTIDSTIFAGYTVGEVEVDDIHLGGEPTLNAPLAVPRLLKDQEGEHDLGAVQLGYRLRTLDNRISPRNGIAVSVAADVYDDSLGSDFDFVKTDVVFDWYDEFDESRPGWSDRYHLGIRGGSAFGFSATRDVPYSERYYLGGQNTLRGFDFRGVGPNENGFPQGGETYLFGTIEYRRPLVTQTQPGSYREVETMHWGLFLDAGVLDPDPFSLDFGELRASAGLLFGLSVPLPITFSFGFPLREDDGDDTRVLGFNIGL